jgi:hypothetical protein
MPALAKDLQHGTVGRDPDHLSGGSDPHVERFRLEILIERRLEDLEVDSLRPTLGCRGTHSLGQSVRPTAIDVGSRRIFGTQHRLRVKAISLARDVEMEAFPADLPQLSKERRASGARA